MTTNTAEELPALPPGDAEWFNDLTVIVPTLRDVCSIGLLLELISALYPGVSCIVVDDGSVRGTEEVVRHESEVLRRKGLHVVLYERRDVSRRGVTASVLDALCMLTTEYFVVLQGDLKHPPEKIGDLITRLRGGADIVVARPVCSPQGRTSLRTLSARIETFFSRRFLKRRGIAVPDPASFFFGGRTSLMKNLASIFAHRFELRRGRVLLDLMKVIATTPGYSSLQIEFVFYGFQYRPKGGG